jgi:glutaredoxin-related protein
LINELGATVEVVELNLDMELGYPIRAELGKRTGRTSVPSVWIGGQFVGGCNDGPLGGVMTLQREDALIPMLVKAKALKK